MSSIRRLLLSAMVFTAAQGGFSQTPEVHFFRTPVPSPDGKQVAFGYQGDIWRVDIAGGRALRLTVHEAYDHDPVWSPDGREIAFAADRFGNDDVYVMPSAGGAPDQLTFFTGNEVPTGWTTDGKNVLFSALRDFEYHRLPLTYSVPRSGGQPFAFFPEYAGESTISPDGKWVAYSTGLIGTWRKGYRGSADLDIFLHNLQDESYLQITEFDGNDFNPLWRPDGKALYYISEADGTYNLWRHDIATKAREQLTHFKGDGVRAAGIARTAGIITFEQGTDIWRLDPTTGAPEKIAIDAPSDTRGLALEPTTFSKDVREMVVSPDENEIAFVVRGEVFVKHKELERAHDVSESAYRDAEISWSNAGKMLAFASDRTGDGDIYVVTSADTAEPRLALSLRREVRRLTDSPLAEHTPKFSPDGKWIAFVRGNGTLMVMSNDGKNARTVLQHWGEPDFAWSPDSRWLAYALPDNEFNYDIWIAPADGSAPAVNITRHPDNDVAPVWSDDGRKLAFVSQRRTNNNQDVWFVFLRREDDEKTKDDFAIEAARKKENGKNAGEKKSTEGKKKEQVPVKIDFADINKRLRRLTTLPGSERSVAISPDGNLFAFVTDTEGKNDLWTVKWDGSDLKQLTTGGANPSQLAFSKDGKTIYYLHGGGTLYSIGADGKDNKAIKFSARMNIDHMTEQRQIFAEAWRTLNSNFYDPKFHGADWSALRKKYAPIAASVQTRRDFNAVVMLMLGELNASHLGIGMPPEDRPQMQTGMLGLQFDPKYAGTGLLVSAVMPDGPCDKTSARMLPGQKLVAIAETPVNRDTNIDALLNNTAGEKLSITVEDAAGKQHHLVVTPITFNQWRGLEYERWRRAKAQRVHELSQNRVGYIHLQAMGAPSLEQFEEELYSEAFDKDGLIIDVRKNGGGWTTDMILAIIDVKSHAFTIPRGGGKGYPQDRRPLYAWTKPVTVLCDQFSISNAEIFSHAIKTLQRGKVVGVPTYGGVISTGARQLIDGSSVRMPFRGWYVQSNGADMENGAAVPDVIVEAFPGDVAKGIDRQLAKAVEVCLQEVEK